MEVYYPSIFRLPHFVPASVQEKTMGTLVDDEAVLFFKPIKWHLYMYLSRTAVSGVSCARVQ